MCAFSWHIKEMFDVQIMMATVPHVTSGSGLRKFLADGFLLDWVYKNTQKGKLKNSNKDVYCKRQVADRRLVGLERCWRLGFGPVYENDGIETKSIKSSVNCYIEMC